MEFLGDPAGLPEALAGSIPPINEIRRVVLPQVPEITVRDYDRPSPPIDDPPAAVAPVEPPIPSVADLVDLPTEAGMPVFGDPDNGDDEVAWLRARSTPPPPPPPFDEPPERPLFAPEPPEGSPTRRAWADVPLVHSSGGSGDRSLAAAGFWPWDAGAGPPGDDDATAERDAVPGRNWLRLAMVVAACLALLVGVAVAFNLGRGRTPLGAERDEPTVAPTLTTPAEPTASPLPDVVADAFDPLGTDGGAENNDAVRLAVDGNPGTNWSTSTYRDQLGSSLPALKSGVGLYLDLGVVREVAAVDLELVGTPTDVQLYVSDDPPDAAPVGQPLATATATDTATLEPLSPDGARAAVTGRYVLVWFTSLPVVPDGFKGGLAEVVVRGR